MFLLSKRFWKRLGYTAGILVAVVLVLYGCLSLWANHKLAPRLAKLRAAGEPTSIAELAPRPAEGTDAEQILAKIKPAIKAATKDYADFYKTALGKAYAKTEDRGEPPSPEMIAAIQKILDRYPEVFTGLEQACSADYYHPALDYSSNFQTFLEELIEKASDLRQCVRLLNWRATVALSQGDSESALRSGLLALKLSRLQEQRPALVSGLVAVAIRYNGYFILNRTMRTGTFSPEQLKKADEELASYDELNWFVQCLRTERAINFDSGADLFAYFPMTWQGTLFQADMMDLYDDLLPLTAKPFFLSHLEISQLDSKFHSTPLSGMLIKLLFPAIEAAQVAANHDLAGIRCLRILVALKIYEIEHNEQFRSLEQLSLSSTEFEDPFSGKPLLMKWTDDGWVIYSVGKNGSDDGGKLAEEQDYGIAPVGYQH